MVAPSPRYSPRKPSCRTILRKVAVVNTAKVVQACQNWDFGDNEWVNEQTGYAEIVRLASGRSLRLKLRLYNVEGAGRDARNEATTCASWGERN